MPLNQHLLQIMPIVAISILILGGCKEASVVDEAPSYYQQIAPILSVNCGSCHREGGMNSYILFDDPDFSQSISRSIAAAVEEGSMPPFYAEESAQCENRWGWKHDPRLSLEELDLISRWAAAGGPIGDPDTAAPVPAPPSFDLADVDLTLYPENPWTTVPFGEISDQFVCFSLDPQLEADQWLEAFQVVPDELAVVHHVLVGIDRSGESAELAGSDGTYDCFGGFGVDAQFIGGWVPGSSPIEFPDYSALRVSAESRLVLQMHYHMAAEAHTDATGLSLRWAEGTPVREAYLSLLGNAPQRFIDGSGLQPGPNDNGSPRFFVPAGATDHTETMYFEMPDMPRNALNFMVANHMHYIGTDMRMWIERGPQSPTTDSACLLHTPSWDFDWQQFYFYDASSGQAPAIYPGDKLWLECRFNNSLDNPGVLRALQEAGLEQPQDIYLGDGSLSEMCIGVTGQVLDIKLRVEAESHSGEIDGAIAIPSAGLIAACHGPASLAIDDDGSVQGVAACGLEWQGTLLTQEYQLTGSLPAGSPGAGEISMTIPGVEGSADGNWTSSGSGGDSELSLNYSLSGSLAGISGNFEGTISVNATP